MKPIQIYYLKNLALGGAIKQDEEHKWRCYDSDGDDTFFASIKHLQQMEENGYIRFVEDNYISVELTNKGHKKSEEYL